ncbi:MAG TPA: hypothetical protein VFH20_08965 [Propionibacteriaceae bacterium]|nr:hypothetical protein [Propionibacteriaceae bacterium]
MGTLVVATLFVATLFVGTLFADTLCETGGADRAAFFISNNNSIGCTAREELGKAQSVP